jgi:dolichol-phosphate mannosyltransferase
LCFALGVAVFGWENHRAWMSKFATAGEWTWFGYNGSLYGMFSRSLTDNPLFVPVLAAPPGTVRVLWLIVAAPIGLATLAAAVRVGVDRAFALLLVGAILLSPLGWSYYFCLAVAPTAAVVLKWRDGPGASPWSKRLLAGGVALMLWPLLPSGLIPFDLGQPNPAATLLIANLCSYSLLAVWIALLVDAVRARRLQAPWTNPRPGLAQERTVTFPLPRLALEDQRVSVVMPVFNETDTVRLICDWLRANLGGRLMEIIVVQSPRSGEESQAVCRALADEDGRIRVYQQENNPGVGHAFREGYARARGNVVLSMDSDNEMELAAIPRMLACLAEGNHGLVVGSRWLKGGGFVGYSGFKRWLNWGFQQLFRLLFNTRLHDLTYGFKALRSEVVHGIAWEAQLHEIGCETTLKPVYLGVRVGEVPSTWTARTQGRSSNNFWRNFRYVATALRILWHGAPLAQPERPAAAEPQHAHMA